MSVTYFNDHSITFILAVNGTTATSYKRSWYDLGLIPAKRPSVATPQPNLKLITIPGSNRKLDLTDITPGGLTFGRRKGQWEFYVDSSKWNSLAECKNYLDEYINGQYVFVILEDDHTHYYTGRMIFSDITNDGGYPKVTLEYDLQYPIGTNNFIYSLVPVVVSISSSMDFLTPSFILGDPLDDVRKYVSTVATYDNGKTDYVDVESFGTGLITYLPSQTVTTRYNGKTSSVTFNVIEGPIVRLEGVLKSGSSGYIWQGSNKDDVRTLYNFYRKYENGYVATRYPKTIETVDGVFSELGTVPVEVESEDVSGTVNVSVDRVERLEPYRYYNINLEYMRVGEWKNRLTYFLTARGYTNNNHVYTYSDDTVLDVENAKFEIVGTESVEVSASNMAVGEYNETVTGNIDISVREAFDIIPDWETVDLAIADGSYKTNFKVGDLVPLTITGVYNGYAQIVAFDSDIDEDGDFIPISWMLKDAIKDQKQYHSVDAYNIPFISTDICSYINNLSTDFPNVLRGMLISSLKEYSYNKTGINSVSDFVQESSFIRIWLPSKYEVKGTASTLIHNKNNYVVDYSNALTLNSVINRITKFPCELDTLNYMNPIRWMTRDLFSFSYQCRLVNRLGDTDTYANAIDRYGNANGSGAKNTDYNNVVFGFCTGATAYDENIDWVIRKFKAIFRGLEYYEWDTFCFENGEPLDTVWDATEADLSHHVIKSEDISLHNWHYPFVTIEKTSETALNYEYEIHIFDYSDNSNLVNTLITKFNMTKISSTYDQTEQIYDVFCRMTTNTRN